MDNPSIRCRIAACNEALDDGRSWSFYLLNDGNSALTSVVLYSVGYEWGDWGSSRDVDVRLTGLAPGANALVWRDDDSGAETRIDLSLRVTADGREVTLNFEFPKLYRQRKLRPVAGLGKSGYTVSTSA